MSRYTLGNKSLTALCRDQDRHRTLTALQRDFLDFLTTRHAPEEEQR